MKIIHQQLDPNVEEHTHKAKRRVTSIEELDKQSDKLPSENQDEKESTKASGRTSPILKRKLHAWPTYQESSGIGDKPNDLVGSIYSQHGDRTISP